MNILVCVKRVPDTSESEVTIDGSGRGINHENMAFVINEADNYALEEALLIKEKLDGTVTLLTIGESESEDILRMGLAKGADSAVRIDDPAFQGSDAIAIAGILATAVKPMEFDLILTGCMASDDWNAQVGPALASFLNVPHASLVTLVETGEGEITVQRELEGGLLAKMALKLPAVVTIQTGINEPRYASIMGIAKASKKPIDTRDAAALGVDAGSAGEGGSGTRLISLSIPVQEKMAEILEGGAEESSTALSEILKERGLI